MVEFTLAIVLLHSLWLCLLWLYVVTLYILQVVIWSGCPIYYL